MCSASTKGNSRSVIVSQRVCTFQSALENYWSKKPMGALDLCQCLFAIGSNGEDMVIYANSRVMCLKSLWVESQ